MRATRCHCAIVAKPSVCGCSCGRLRAEVQPVSDPVSAALSPTRLVARGAPRGVLQCMLHVPSGASLLSSRGTIQPGCTLSGWPSGKALDMQCLHTTLPGEPGSSARSSYRQHFLSARSTRLVSRSKSHCSERETSDVSLPLDRRGLSAQCLFCLQGGPVMRLPQAYPDEKTEHFVDENC